MDAASEIWGELVERHDAAKQQYERIHRELLTEMTEGIHGSAAPREALIEAEETAWRKMLEARAAMKAFVEQQVGDDDA